MSKPTMRATTHDYDVSLSLLETGSFFCLYISYATSLSRFEGYFVPLSTDNGGVLNLTVSLPSATHS